MTIKGTFLYVNEYVEVIVRGNELLFNNPSTNTITTISGLRLNKAGVIKEFSDLEDDDEWKSKVIERLKEHLKKMKTEEQKLIYVKEELIKYGYKPLYKQRAGFRTHKL